MLNLKLFQPILSKKPEPGHITDAFTFPKWLELITLEEDYYEGDQNKTKLMFTLLRKIYYDSWGWSTQVIRAVADVPGRYYTEMVPVYAPSQETKSKSFYKHKQYDIPTLSYKVVYRADDKVYPERAGQTPEIYANDGQEIINPQGYYCDIGHIFSGIDAWNNFAPISPLPDWLMWCRFLLPSVDSNVDFATWLGDIASTAGDFLIDQLKNKKIPRDEEQSDIDRDAPGSDMLGDIDPYVIIHYFDTKCEVGMRISQMISQYYHDEGCLEYQAKKFSIFSKYIGLKDLVGDKFSNEKEWLKKYKKQLRNATIFYVYGEVGKFKGLWLAIKIWLRLFEKKLALTLLLQIFIDELKNQIRNEQGNLAVSDKEFQTKRSIV